LKKLLTQSLLRSVAGEPLRGAAGSNGELALGRLAVKDFGDARVLERLLMYERRLESSLYKTLLELQRLNIARRLKAEGF
jgi:hypothetical protein